jgi:hypothetical protein
VKPLAKLLSLEISQQRVYRSIFWSKDLTVSIFRNRNRCKNVNSKMTDHSDCRSLLS